MIEKLKEVKIDELSSKELVVEHRNQVLSLEKDDVVDYLKYAIDNFYKTEDEGENADMVNEFFDCEEFKPYYDVLLETDESDDVTSGWETNKNE